MTDATKKKISKSKTAYQKRYCREIVEYFSNSCTERDGRGCIKSIPSYVSFARRIGVTARTLENWRHKYPKFGEACQECDELLKATIIGEGLSFRMHASFAKFILSSRYGMKEKVEITPSDDATIELSPELSELLERRKERQK